MAAKNEINSHTNPVADLVMAILAVNQWTLAQSGAIFEGLKKENLFDPLTIQQMDDAELQIALKRAGYKKADFVVGLISSRLHDMAKKLAGDGEQDLRDLVLAKNKKELREFLMGIKGVGPKVYENFLLLNDIR